MNRLIFDYAVHRVCLTLDKPLKAISSKESSLLIKTISGLAIGVLFVCSAGSYGVYTYRFFKERRLAVLHHDLLNLIDQKDHAKVAELIKKHPVLKTVLNSDFDKDGYRFNFPETMAKALVNNDLPMIKILHKNGAKMDGMRIIPMTYAIQNGYYEIVKFLAENGEMVLKPLSYANDAITYKNSTFDITKFFLEKATAAEIAEDQELFLGICTSLEIRGRRNPKYLELLDILVKKYDRL